MRLFGWDINRTSGELEAVLTQLQLGEIPTRGLFERVVLCCLFCLSRRSYLWRSSASSGAIVWSCSCGSCLVYERREVFVHERSRVLRCHLGCLSLFFSLLVRLFVRWHYAEHIGDRRGYDLALAAMPPELRSSWVDREHNRGCPVLRVLLAWGRMGGMLFWTAPR